MMPLVAVTPRPKVFIVEKINGYWSIQSGPYDDMQRADHEVDTLLLVDYPHHLDTRIERPPFDSSCRHCERYRFYYHQFDCIIRDQAHA